MIIDQSPKTTMQRLFHLDSKAIKITYESREELISQLNKVQSLTLTSDPYFDDSVGIATIRPKIKNDIYRYDNIPESLKKELKGYTPQEIVISDFQDSREFYTNLSIEKSKHKILDDEFSTARGEVLFKYIATIEKGLKEEIKRFYKIEDSGAKPKNYRKGDPDYFINFYDVGELLEAYLLAPVSNEHFIELIRAAGNDKNRILDARKKTKLKELDLPFKEEDIITFSKIRNKTMHFRVVTPDDCVQMLNLSQKYAHFFTNKVLGSAAKKRVR